MPPPAATIATAPAPSSRTWPRPAMVVAWVWPEHRARSGSSGSRRESTMAGSDKHFDVIVAGGHVLDPGAGIEGDYDIGISDGRITAIATALDRGPTTRVMDARDHIVAPGLVDLHTHVYWGAT